jgi:hypothetical protein
MTCAGDAYTRALTSMLAAHHLLPLCAASDYAILIAICTSAIQELLASVDETLQIATQLAAGGSRTVATTSELTKRVQLLEGLLRVPATLEYSAMEALVSFFEDMFRGLAGKHGEHALAKAAVVCLVNFFTFVGVDAYSLMPRVRSFACHIMFSCNAHASFRGVDLHKEYGPPFVAGAATPNQSLVARAGEGGGSSLNIFIKGCRVAGVQGGGALCEAAVEQRSVRNGNTAFSCRVPCMHDSGAACVEAGRCAQQQALPGVAPPSHLAVSQ